MLTESLSLLGEIGNERVTPPEIDYAELFEATPSPYLVLDPDLVVANANRAYLQATGRSRDDLVGRYLFDALPGNPLDPGADGREVLSASLHRVVTTCKPDAMALVRHDMPRPGRLESYEERWWSPTNTPVLGRDGNVQWIIHRMEDVSPFVRSRQARQVPSGELDEREESMQAELYARARALQRLNDELRESNAREREVAVTLQEAMLKSPDLGRHPDIAVRYLPAVGSLNVCGDWYDIADLPNGRFTVAVGDVVGHGLHAATVMGMLRSALSAASRAVESPAQALEVLGRYARSVEGALSTTAVTVLVDPRSHLIIYSSAGHPPPVLLHLDGTCDLLDQATDPPLGARPEHVPRPQTGLAYRAGDVLVLYTDGLIERRSEDIDAGMARLTETLTAHCTEQPAHLADSILADLGVSGGSNDDIALLVARL